MNRTLQRRGGWRRRPLAQSDLTGYFLIADRTNQVRRYRGRLQAGAGGAIDVYVEDPPRRGRYVHESCLQYITGDWFKLHFERPPRSFEAAIVFTEHYLACCLAGYEVA